MLHGIEVHQVIDIGDEIGMRGGEFDLPFKVRKGGGARLFAENMFARLQSGDRLRTMRTVRAAEKDGVHLWVGEHFSVVLTID